MSAAGDDEDDILNSFMKEINELPAENPEINEKKEEHCGEKESEHNVDREASGKNTATSDAAADSADPANKSRKVETKVVSVVASSSHPVYVYKGGAASTATSGATGASVSSTIGSVHDVPRGNFTSSAAASSSTSTSTSVGQFSFATSSSTTTTRQPPPPPPRTGTGTGASAGAPHVRKAAGTVWSDPTLAEWPENDFRLFVGDLAKETTDAHLAAAFKAYPSFAMARVVCSQTVVKGRGYGFVSFLDPMDCARALREMNGKYLGSRPMKISKSTWKDREIGEVRKKEEKKRKFQQSLGLA